MLWEIYFSSFGVSIGEYLKKSIILVFRYFWIGDRGENRGWFEEGFYGLIADRENWLKTADWAYFLFGQRSQRKISIFEYKVCYGHQIRA